MIPAESPYPPGGVCVATGELTRYAMFNQDLAMLRVPDGSALVWTSGPLIAANLNNNFARTMESPRIDAASGRQLQDLQWAWIIGDDHTLDPMILMTLLGTMTREGLDIVVPLCLNREPPCAFTIIDERNNRHRDFDKVPTSGTFELEDFEVCGDAGMLLSRRALERLGPPWYDALISGAKTSEDRYFARKIRERGMSIHVDTSVILGHITPCLIEPVRGDDGWLVRFSVGRSPLVQFRPVPEPEAVPA